MPQAPNIEIRSSYLVSDSGENLHIDDDLLDVMQNAMNEKKTDFHRMKTMQPMTG